jgi:hypothetical protein
MDGTHHACMADWLYPYVKEMDGHGCLELDKSRTAAAAQAAGRDDSRWRVWSTEYYVHGPYVGGGRPPAHAPNSGAKRHLGPARGPLCGVDGSAAARTTRWQKVNIYCGYSTPVQVKC